MADSDEDDYCPAFVRSGIACGVCGACLNDYHSHLPASSSPKPRQQILVESQTTLKLISLPPNALASVSQMLPFVDACSLFLLSKGCHSHATAHMPQQCLILDIDGTLIGSICHKLDANQQIVDERMRPDWVFSSHDWFHGQQFYLVHLRPYLKTFLEYAAQRFRRVAIWYGRACLFKSLCVFLVVSVLALSCAKRPSAPTRMTAVSQPSRQNRTQDSSRRGVGQTSV